MIPKTRRKDDLSGMCELLVKIKGRHCQSEKVVKNGKKPNGKQNFNYKNCGKQFLVDYSYKGADVVLKSLIVKLLLNNSGIRDIVQIVGVSAKTVLRQVLLLGQNRQIEPCRTQYQRVQIDELWSYVGHKKAGKRWIIYAYAPETKEILGDVIGSRGIKTVRKLAKMLQSLTITEYCTDHWVAFRQVFAAQHHRIGKEFTRHIEGVNTSLRAKNRRLVRKTTCFSKKDDYHQAAILAMFWHRNKTHVAA